MDPIPVKRIDFCKSFCLDNYADMDARVHRSDEYLECTVDSFLPENADGAVVDPLHEDRMKGAVKERGKMLRGMLEELKKLIKEKEELFDSGTSFSQTETQTQPNGWVWVFLAASGELFDLRMRSFGSVREDTPYDFCFLPSFTGGRIALCLHSVS